MINKLAIGTVQFGMPYGVANTNGQVDVMTAKSILELAQSNGIDTLDTAIVYGESEKTLGRSMTGSWQIVSKLPAVPDDCEDIVLWVNQQTRESLNRLEVNRLYGILLHRPMQLLEPYGIELWHALQDLKEAGIVDKIGFSIYQPVELDALFDGFIPDLVQVPFNLLDRRIEISGWLARLFEEKVEVHARSVFLQGLLLMDETVRPKKFNRWLTIWTTLHDWLKVENLTALQGALAFSLSNPMISKVIVGVDRAAQLNEILMAAGTSIANFPEALTTSDLDLIDSSRWR